MDNTVSVKWMDIFMMESSSVKRSARSESALRRTAITATDFFLSGLLTICGPALRRFAISRGQLPRASASADDAQISIIRHHYYSPAVNPRDLLFALDSPRSLPGIKLDVELHRSFLDGLNFGDELRAIPMDQSSPTSYGYRNGFFESGDAEILYGVIRRDKPRRIIEVGSGRSTLVAALAISRNRAEDESYSCQHICIEPFESPWLEQIGVEVIRDRIEQIDPAFFDQLENGDIFFVDSSHVLRPQGDVIFEINEIYPRLKPGVLVQIHDIFTPRDYPHQWLMNERRIWNEQYVLEAFLSGNPNYDIVCALNWLANDHPDMLANACPVLRETLPNQPGSFWMRRSVT
jgi:predicted O-methyltransferase YrrM